MDAFCSPPWIELQVAHAASAWERSASGTTVGGPRYSHAEQRKREHAYDRALSEVEGEARRAATTSRVRTQQQLLACFSRFAATALGLDAPAVDLLTHGFVPAGMGLAQWAHRFDASLSHADIAQACRNGWTACGLQRLLGERMQMTPAILAYSLLYPYSDNYLDARRVAQSDKVQFSRRFRARLCGESVAPRDAHENSTWYMVEMIERQYPREVHPCVFDSLLAIHHAQEVSLKQLHAHGALSRDEILRISCAKGGASVLADACLVRGSLTDPESAFAFAWGVLLQLGDDLQDLHEDLWRGSKTLFTQAIARGEPLDALLGQLLQFGEWVTSLMQGLAHGEEAFRQLLWMSWRSLVLMAAAYAPEFFSPDFLAGLEAGSPFRFAFLRARRERLRGKIGLFEHLFHVLLEAPSEGLQTATPSTLLLGGVDPASQTA